MDSECKCQYPNYTALTGRCMTCGGFHKKDLDFSFDYKSRDWENSNSKPVCVACLNESRAHQIPGSYEHICGKQIDNTQQLPAEYFLSAEKVNFIMDEIKKLKASNRGDYEAGEFDAFNHKQEGRYHALSDVLQ